MGKKKDDISDSESDLSDEQPKENLLDKVKNAENIPKPHQRKEFVEPETDETEDQPPFVVVVQGPKKSGKTTLIKSLVKHYTRHKINSVNGTITLRSGKNSRVTFVECPNDINGMIDLAKVADLCLTLVDASIGFEMQTFEFLSILQSHGFPNVMGVLTHLDFFKENKQKRKTTKALKKRFAQEIGDNFKLFYLSGLKYDLYHKADTHNLARFISIMKFKQTEWKSMHPHILVDRFENISEENLNDEDSCRVTFFGYIRGCSYRLNNSVHITGLGDYDIKEMKVIEDPCPPLNKNVKADEDDKEGEGEGGEGTGAGAGADGLVKKAKKKRSLKQNERLIYAPQSNLGFLNYEQSSGYITIPDKHVIFTRIEEETFDEDGNPIKVTMNEDTGEGVEMVRKLQDLEKGLNEKFQEEEEPMLLDGIKLGMDEEEDESIDEDEEVANRRREIQEAKDRSLAAFADINEGTSVGLDNISKKIYEEEDPVFRQETFPALDCSNYKTKTFQSRAYYQALVKSKFVTGGMHSDDEEGSDKEDKEDKEANEDDDEDEDDDKKKKKEGEAEEGEFNIVDPEKEKSFKLRNKMKDELLDLEYGIYKKGLYVRVEVENIKFKHFKKFKPEIPIILCRINPAEDTFGFLKIKIKKHRWYSNILKSNDPLILSIGWRRYQSIPMFCVEDVNDRLRYVKYTPQHDFCIAVFYGNFAPQNTGVICTQTIREDLSKFRIAATGYIMELNHSFQVMKKLKLIGEPFQIYKNTAFIKNMFNTKLEVSKFEGAAIKTVSGIRGQIKKAIKEGPKGSFRATFEDKILMSDIVFMRTWFKVDPEKFYNPLSSYQDTRLMKTTWELRKEREISAPINPDSEYKEIVRKKRVFNPLVIPKRLESNLPFASKQKVPLKKQKDALLDSLPIKSLKSDHEKQVYALIQRLNTIKNEKKKLEKEKKVEKKIIDQKRHIGEHKEYMQKKKEQKKQKYSKQQSLKKKQKVE